MSDNQVNNMYIMHGNTIIDFVSSQSYQTAS